MLFKFFILIGYLLYYQAVLILALFTSKVSAESVARCYLWSKALNPHRVPIYFPLSIFLSLHHKTQLKWSDTGTGVILHTLFL